MLLPIVVAAAFIITFSISNANAAAVDYFLKIEGIPGESESPTHPNEIDVLSWSWGASQACSLSGGGGGTSCVSSFSDVSFLKPLDKSSPHIFLAVATGQHLSKATLFGTTATEKDTVDFLMITMTDVIVTSYQIGGSGEDRPTDSISLNYAKIEFEYKPQNKDGSFGSSIKTGWDLKKNTKV